MDILEQKIKQKQSELISTIEKLGKILADETIALKDKAHHSVMFQMAEMELATLNSLTGNTPSPTDFFKLNDDGFVDFYGKELLEDKIKNQKEDGAE